MGRSTQSKRIPTKPSNRSLNWDATVPIQLKDLQSWFGKIISTPLDSHDRTFRYPNKGRDVKKESDKKIISSPQLTGFERIQIYNQQYWWRLYKCLQESFPTILRLFSYHPFNREIAIPYFMKFPPNDWSLGWTGKFLPQWLKTDYKKKDGFFLSQMAEIDWAFNESFTAAHYPLKFSEELTEESLEKLLNIPIAFQPHLFFFTFSHSLFELRQNLNEHPVEFWEEHPFPECKEEKIDAILYRNKHCSVVWESLTKEEFFWLSHLKKVGTLEVLCNEMLENEALLYREEGQKYLGFWIKKWISLGWVYFP